MIASTMTPQVYEYVAATIVKSVTEKSPATAGTGADAYDAARGGMTRDEAAQYCLQARHTGEGITFRYGVFQGDPNVSFGTWHQLPPEYTHEAARYLRPGDETMTVTVRYTELDSFL